MLKYCIAHLPYCLNLPLLILDCPQTAKTAHLLKNVNSGGNGAQNSYTHAMLFYIYTFIRFTYYWKNI